MRHRRQNFAGRWQTFSRPARLTCCAIVLFGTGVFACTPIAAVHRDEDSSSADGSGPRSSMSASSSATPRTGSDEPKAVTAQVADACSEPGAHICATSDVRTPLMCKDAKWSPQASCDMNQRCETAAGPLMGTCVPIASECLSHAPGEDFCDGDFVRSCKDLVLTAMDSCPERRRCEEVNGAAECVCATGWIDAGNGCQAPTSCAVDNGGCDAMTQCSIQGTEPVCSVCPPGFEGKGATGCFAQLSTLTIEDGTVSLTPAFTPEVHSYRVALPLLRQSVHIAAQALVGVKLAIDNVDQEAGTLWQSSPLPLGEHKIEINLSTSIGLKSKYELTVERVGIQEAYIKASAPDESDEFGSAVAVWGDTLVIGANLEDGGSANPDDDSVRDSGGVYVFARNGNAWSQQAHLKSSTPLSGDYFGTSVALWEDTLVVGAPGSNTIGSMTPHGGSVHVFQRQGQQWNHVDRIAPANTGLQDLFGQSVALDDKHLAVGAPLESSIRAFGGSIYVYARSDLDRPTQLRPMVSIDTGLFGWAVAIEGDTLVVGAPNYNYTGLTELGPGNAYVFTGGGAQWTQLQELTPAASLENAATFGWAVALAGNLIAVGAPRARASNVGQPPGDAYVYERAAVGGSWTMQQAIRATVPRASDWFGYALKISPTVLVIGSPGDASSSTGFSGDPKLDNTVESGALSMYGRNKDQWIPTAYIKASNPDKIDDFGGTVAMHGDTLVSSATGESSNASGIGGNEASNAAARAGAGYVFR